MAPPPSPTRPFLTTLSLAAAAAGFLTFAHVRYHWVQHATAKLATPQYAILLPIALAALLGVWAWRSAARHHRPHRIHRWTKALRPLAAGLPLALWQWAQWHFSTDSPWPLYAWIALLAFCVWRIGPLIRPREIRRRTMWLCVTSGTVAMVAMHVSMQNRMWHDLSFGYHDIGMYARALHSAVQGRGLWVDSLGRSILGEHPCFALWALAPFCMLGAAPFKVLIVASAVCLDGTALIVAWYVRRRFRSNLAAAIAAIAWLLLPVHGCLIWSHSYGFHAVQMAVPLLAAGLALTALRRFGPAAICMLSTLLIREDIALTVAAWAIYVVLVEKKRLLGTITTIAALAYLWLAVAVLVPNYRGEPYPYLASRFDISTIGATIAGPLGVNASFLLTLLLPVAGLALWRPALAILTVPVLAETMLTANNEYHNLSFWYYTPAVPLLFFAATEAWHRLGAARPKCDLAQMTAKSRTTTARFLRPGWALLAAALFCQTYLGIGPHTNNHVAPFSPPGLRQEIDNINHLRATAPRTATVTASYRIAAHFTDFNRLWTVRNKKLGDIVIIDDRDNWDGSTPRAALTRAHRAGGYRPIFADYHLVILTNDQGPAPLTNELMPHQIPDGLTPVQLDLGSGIQLVAMRTTNLTPTAAGATRVRITLIWTCRQTPPTDFRFGLTAGDAGTRWGPFHFARGAYPTNTWKPGAFYRDDLTITQPPTTATKPPKLKPILLR